VHNWVTPAISLPLLCHQNSFMVSKLNFLKFYL
jgi:hypothetical protein